MSGDLWQHNDLTDMNAAKVSCVDKALVGHVVQFFPGVDCLQVCFIDGRDAKGFLPDANLPKFWIIASSSWNKVWAGKTEDEVKTQIKASLQNLGISFHKNASASTLKGGNRGLLDETQRLKLAQKLMKDAIRKSKPPKAKEPRTCPHCHKEARIKLQCFFSPGVDLCFVDFLF